MTPQPTTRTPGTDLHDRQVLVRSWLHTLHGSQLDLRPRTDQPMPGLRALVANAAAWHVAYALMGLIGSLLIARSGSGSVVAEAVATGGRSALAVTTLVIWWGGTALATTLWWFGVQVLRSGSSSA